MVTWTPSPSVKPSHCTRSNNPRTYTGCTHISWPYARTTFCVGPSSCKESSRKWTDNSTWAQGCFLLVKRKPPIRTWEQLELFRNLGHVQHKKAKNLMIKCSMQKSFIVPEWTRSYHLTVFSQLDSENTHSSQTARQTHFTGHAHSWLGSRAPGLVWEVWERLRVIWNIPRPGSKKKLETSRNFCNCSLFFGEFFSHRHCCLYC